MPLNMEQIMIKHRKYFMQISRKTLGKQEHGNNRMWCDFNKFYLYMNMSQLFNVKNKLELQHHNNPGQCSLPGLTQH